MTATETADHTVVVLADDPLIQEDVKYGFPPDVRVIVLEDRRAALDLMKDVVPDAVIAVMRTGNAGGFALARDMSQRVGLKDVPVLMILERMQDEWLAREAGAALIRTKPIEASDLVTDALSLFRSSN